LKASYSFCFLILLSAFGFNTGAHAQKLKVSPLSGRVNDYAGILSRAMVAELEELLKSHEQATSNQIAILTISSLHNEILEEYALRVVENWQLGREGHDNGWDNEPKDTFLH
jgi:uncharacterized protein